VSGAWRLDAPSRPRGLDARARRRHRGGVRSRIDTAGRELEAGAFGPWLDEMRRALRLGADVDVPCGECSACCSSAHFVHIGPDERRALGRIPHDLLFPAPGLPPGHMVLPYDERGRCPMLDARGRCAIYEHRPITCRTYDCRVFAAAGIDADRDAISRRARRWRFACPTQRDEQQLRAVRAAASWIPAHAAAFPGGAVPDDPAALAVLAVRVADVFLPGGLADAGAQDASIVAAVVAAAVEDDGGAVTRANPAVAYRGRRA
jgi:hypothetical protein